jgi:type III secretory pathway component EscU
MKTRGEIIYRLTQLYIPKQEELRKKMIASNKKMMHHFNHDENDEIRKNKRKIKEELKSSSLKAKVKH